MSQDGMDQHWAEMTPAGRLRTIRNEVIVGYFESAREHWLCRLDGEPGIAEIVGELKAAERHRDRAACLLLGMENAAERAADLEAEATERVEQADELKEKAEDLEDEANKLREQATELEDEAHE